MGGKHLGKFTFPKLSTTDRDAIGTWTSGNAIYNTTENAQQYYTGSSWATVGPSGGGETIINTNRPPNETDDSDAGNFEGQRWIDNSQVPRALYICVDDTNGAADWEFVNHPPDLRYDSVKVVQSEDDLPAPNMDDKIPLDDFVYIIDSNDWDQTKTYLFGARSQINGIAQNVTNMSSSVNGTIAEPFVYFESNSNLFMNDIQMEYKGVNQLMWKNIDDGTVPEGVSFELNRFNILNFQPAGHGCRLGYLKDIRQGFVGTFSCFNVEEGFICAGAWDGGFRIDNTIFINSNGVFFGSDPTDNVIFQRRFSSNANLTVPLGSIGYDFPETSFPNDGQYQLQDGNVRGDGVYVTDWASGSPHRSIKANFKGNTGIPNTFPGGGWQLAADSFTAFPAQNTWVTLNLTTVNKNLTWFSEANGIFTYLGSTLFELMDFNTIVLVGKTGDVIDLMLQKYDNANSTWLDVQPGQLTIRGTLSQGKSVSTPLQAPEGLLYLDQLRVQARNTTGSQGVTAVEGTNGFINGR